MNNPAQAILAEHKFSDYAIFIFRTLLGSVLVLGGIKLLLNTPESAANLLSPTGFVRPEMASFIPDAYFFAITVGIVELLVGSVTISGFKTKYVSIAGALLFLLFIVMSPIFGYTRLFIDVALWILYISLALVGGGKYSLDGFFGKNYHGFTKDTKWFYLLVRVAVSFAFFMSIFFPQFNSDGLQFMPMTLSAVLGSLLIIGLPNRGVAIAATIVLIAVAVMNVPEHTILNTKRAIGLLAGTFALSILGVGSYSISSLIRKKKLLVW